VIFLDISYTLIRSSRKTVALEIRPDGSILVRAPKGLSDRAIRDFVLSREGWISSRLRKFRDRPPLPRLTEAALAQLKQQAREDLISRAAFWAPRVGVSFGNISIRAQKTRWGSCSAQGNLNFNCLLMLAPPQVRDYVVIHELCHRKHMNHAPAFWSEVAQVCPDYPRHRAWLKDNGNSLIARLPE
jgi:predicted metal-dependent hydrolase